MKMKMEPHSTLRPSNLLELWVLLELEAKGRAKERAKEKAKEKAKAKERARATAKARDSN